MQYGAVHYGADENTEEGLVHSEQYRAVQYGAVQYGAVH